MRQANDAVVRKNAVMRQINRDKKLIVQPPRCFSAHYLPRFSPRPFLKDPLPSTEKGIFENYRPQRDIFDNNVAKHWHEIRKV